MKTNIKAKNCANMNHSRSNPPVKYCPTCGDRFQNSQPSESCDDTKHRARRKDRNLFCFDCGMELAKLP